MDYEEEDYDEAAEIAEAEKTYIIQLVDLSFLKDVPDEKAAKSAWVRAQMSNKLEEIIRYIEREIQPHFDVEITQRLDGSGTLFVKAEADQAAALFDIPNCHVSRNSLDVTEAQPLAPIP